MEKNKFKALALDLDGTLTDSQKKLPKENKEAIWKAMDQGITIILASGRSTMGIDPLAKELEFDKRGGIVIAFSGGKAYDYKTGTDILNRILPKHLIPDICEIAAKYGTHPVSYDGVHVISEYAEEPLVQFECVCNYAPLLKVDSLPAHLDFPVNKLMISGDHDQLIKVRDELLEKHADEMSSFFAESYFLEAAPKGIGKDSALDAVCKYLNITPSELMVCGDGYNDIAMFDFAGFAVGMKNAYPEAAAHADVVVPKTNDECGVAYAINQYLLTENKK